MYEILKVVGIVGMNHPSVICYHPPSPYSDGSSVLAVLKLLGDVGTGTDILLVCENCVLVSENLDLPLLTVGAREVRPTLEESG